MSAKLASPATETDLRITCAEVLGAVGHANPEAAQAVLNQQGACMHSFTAAMSTKHALQASVLTCQSTLAYWPCCLTRVQQSKQQFHLRMLHVLHLAPSCILHQLLLPLPLCKQNKRDSMLHDQMTTTVPRLQVWFKPLLLENTLRLHQKQQ